MTSIIFGAQLMRRAQNRQVIVWTPESVTTEKRSQTTWRSLAKGHTEARTSYCALSRNGKNPPLVFCAIKPEPSKSLGGMMNWSSQPMTRSLRLGFGAVGTTTIRPPPARRTCSNRHISRSSAGIPVMEFPNEDPTRFRANTMARIFTVSVVRLPPCPATPPVKSGGGLAIGGWHRRVG